MTTLEQKILEALKAEKERIKKYDAVCQEIADDYMRKAAEQTSDYWKKDYERSAQFHLSQQKHGYEFHQTWKNAISGVMFGRIYYEWHPAQAGRYKGTGHGAYATSELTDEEQEIVDKVFNGLVKHGYLKISKSGKMATFKG
jgi:hypothetical protein